MENYVPLEKRSKKEQRAWYAARRGSWNGVNPVTKIVPDKKRYNRKKQKLRREDFPDAVFLSLAEGIQILPNSSRFSWASIAARVSSANQPSTILSSSSVSHQRNAAVSEPSSLLTRSSSR